MTEPVNVADYFEAAAARVDPSVWCYFEGGAGDEVTLRANRGAYGRWRLRPRVLVDVGEVSTATTVLGTPVSMPLLVAPVAMQCYTQVFDEEGKLENLEAFTSVNGPRFYGLPVSDSTLTRTPEPTCS